MNAYIFIFKLRKKFIYIIFIVTHFFKSLVIILFLFFDVSTLNTLMLIIYIMAINQLEENLEAITRTIEQLKRDGCTDEKILNELREERDKILKDLNL